jgi:sugar O-acyltransferase (sialic acid O-acetyltransferase NeuD family)
MNRPVILLGGGGHAKVLAEILLRLNREIIGFTDPGAGTTLFNTIPHLGTDEAVLDHGVDEVSLVNGLGSVGDSGARQKLFSTFSAKGYRFSGVSHPGAIISTMDVTTGQGCQILAGAVINPGTQLGENVIVNSGAVVEHDCQIGNHVHISPGAVICGNCTIGEGSHIGAGAVVIQGIEIGNGAIIAAGSVVISNVAPATLIAGVPGKAKRGKN